MTVRKSDYSEKHSSSRDSWVEPELARAVSVPDRDWNPCLESVQTRGKRTNVSGASDIYGIG